MSLRELKESTTNSPLGSYHWFHTHLARIKHIGEFMKTQPKDKVLTEKWGKDLFDSACELIDGYDSINSQPEEEARGVQHQKPQKEEFICECDDPELDNTPEPNTRCLKCGNYFE